MRVAQEVRPNDNWPSQVDASGEGDLARDLLLDQVSLVFRGSSNRNACTAGVSSLSQSVSGQS
jgi:hypothetical protein